MADALLAYANALAFEGDLRGPAAPNQEAVWSAIREGIDTARRCPPGSRRDRLLARGHELLSDNLLATSDDHAAAAASAEEALALRLRDRGENHLHAARARQSLGLCRLAMHEYSQAEGEFRLALAGYGRVFNGRPNLYATGALRNLVGALAWQYKDAEVAAVLRGCPPGWDAPAFRFVAGADVAFEWGWVCLQRGDYADAERHFDTALSARHANPVGLVDMAEADAQFWLAEALVMRDEWPAAGRAVEPWLSDARTVAGGSRAPAATGPINRLGEDPFVFYANVLLFSGLTNVDDARRAQALARRRIGEIAARPVAERFPFVVTDGYAYYELKDYAAAAAGMRVVLGGMSPWQWHFRRIAERVLVESLDHLDDPAAAEQVRRAAVDDAEKLLPSGHPEVAAKRVLLADMLARHGRHAAAARELDQAFESLSRHPQAADLIRRRADVADRLIAASAALNDQEQVRRWQGERARYPPPAAPAPHQPGKK